MLNLFAKKSPPRARHRILKNPSPSFFSGSFNPWCVVLGVAFVALHSLLDRESVVSRDWVGTDAWYPPAGLELALLIGLDISYAPLIFVAGFVTSLVNYHLSPFSANIWYVNGLIATSYAVMATLLRRYIRVHGILRSLQNVFRYSFVVMGATLVLAFCGSLSFVWSGKVSFDHYVATSLNWWIGDSVALFCLTPFLLVYVTPWLKTRLSRSAPIKPQTLKKDADPWPRTSHFQNLLELLGQGGGIVAVLYITIASRFAGKYQLFYLFFLPII